jgi:hypothetical protein
MGEGWHMANRQSFGRRGGPQIPRKPAQAVPAVVAQAAIAPAEIPAEPAFSLDMEPAPDLHAELREWKAQRTFVIPWRQISLMASLCFGLASFVLPDSVSDYVNWLLYGLSAMSFYVWFSQRRAKKKKS